MKKSLVTLFALLLQISFVFGQALPNRYEVEMLSNPNPGRKDTREINSVIVFEKDALKIVSRRKNEVFKEIKYADIKTVEHSFSKKPPISNETAALILTVLTGLPIFLIDKEKHWLTIVGQKDFAVLKLENDNFRLIKAELEIRKFAVAEINENKR